MNFWLAFLFAAAPLAAQFGLTANVISVTGDAEVKVVPDRVVISVGVETRNPSLQPAKTQNDEAVKAILAAASRHAVAAGDIQTDFIEINPVFQEHNSSARREGYLVDYYRVHKAMAITLRNVSRFESLLTAVVAAGANRVYGVEFQTADMRRYRDQAREMAVKAAVEKAQAMATAAGLKIGPATSIGSFNFGGGAAYGRYPHDPYGRGSAMAQNVSISTGGDSNASGTFAPGRISVTAQVSLTFPIKQ